MQLLDEYVCIVYTCVCMPKILNKDTRDAKALKIIRNHLVHTGEMPSVRDLMREMDYKSPRSASLVIDGLVERGYLRKNNGEYTLIRDLPSTTSSTMTVMVPLVGSVACGTPTLAEENIEGYFQVSTKLANPNSQYFILRAEGDSMNLTGIENGALVLVRKQAHAENGDKVVALIDGETTIKELNKGLDVVMLLPRSNNPKHRPIILQEDFSIQGKVICTLPNI